MQNTKKARQRQTYCQCERIIGLIAAVKLIIIKQLYYFSKNFNVI